MLSLALAMATASGAELALDGSDFPWGVLATDTRPCDPMPIPEGMPDIPPSSAACMVKPDEPVTIGPLSCESLSYTWVEYALTTVGCHTGQSEGDVRKALRKALGRGTTRWALDDGKEVRLMDAGLQTVVLWWRPPEPADEPINPGFP